MTETINDYATAYHQAWAAGQRIVRIKVSPTFWTRILAETVHTEATPCDQLMGIAVVVDDHQTADYVFQSVDDIRAETRSLQRQMAAAADQMRQHAASLQADGWTWSDETRQWTHPDRPGTLICY